MVYINKRTTHCSWPFRPVRTQEEARVQEGSQSRHQVVSVGVVVDHKPRPKTTDVATPTRLVLKSAYFAASAVESACCSGLIYICLGLLCSVVISPCS